MRFSVILLITLVLDGLALGCLTSNSYADEIYKWTDKNGRTHFSDKPFTQGQTKAKLPDVKKINYKKRIQKLKKYSDKSCVNHGGVDCSQGKDKSDNSAICLDGYRESLIKYDERCLNVKLEVNTVVSKEKRTTKIEASIRNESAIKAENLKVKFRLEEFRSLEFELVGAKEIEAYGLENYIFVTDKKLDKKYPNRKIVGKTIVKCDNCSNIKRKKVRYK